MLSLSNEDGIGSLMFFGKMDAEKEKTGGWIMTIKEVEELLEIPRATVRYYEKEGLITPSRGENDYRNYSEEDISTLKKVITLRKIGIAISDIEDIFDGAKDLQTVVSGNMQELENKMEELKGALLLSRYIVEKGESAESFSGETYWNMVLKEEEKGNRFLEVLDGIVQYEKKVALKQLGLGDRDGNLNVTAGKAILAVAAYFLCCGITYLVMGRLFEGKWMAANLKQGLLWPVEIFIVYSVVGIPLYFLEKKHKKGAQILKKIYMGLAVGIVAACILIVILS